MTLAEYAKHRGVDDSAISRAIQFKRITRNADGWIDSEQADKDWEANTSRGRSAAGKRNGKLSQALKKKRPERTAEQIAEAAAVAATPVVYDTATNIEIFTNARADRERAQASLVQLDLDERNGKLIDRAKVIAAASSSHRILRDAILSIPDRIASQLAAESDTVATHRMLEDELRAVLDHLAELLLNIDPPAPRRRAAG